MGDNYVSAYPSKVNHAIIRVCPPYDFCNFLKCFSKLLYVKKLKTWKKLKANEKSLLFSFVNVSLYLLMILNHLLCQISVVLESGNHNQITVTFFHIICKDSLHDNYWDYVKKRNFWNFCARDLILLSNDAICVLLLR